MRISDWSSDVCSSDLRIDIPSDLAMREAADRFHMLEQLADHDDVLLEQLLEDKAPSQETVLADLASETASNLVVPVLFGSATTGFGIRRLLQMLRPATTQSDRSAARWGGHGPSPTGF